MKYLIILLFLCIVFDQFWRCRTNSMCDVDPNWRIDCYPESVPLPQEHCYKRGCCYHSNVLNDAVPWCYFPKKYATYHLSQLTNTSFGYTGTLTLNATQHQAYGPRISQLSLDMIIESKERLHFRLRDLHNQRFEVPISTPNIHKAANGTLYDVDIKSDHFGIIVSRKSSGAVLMNTTIAPLIYADQFLQISSTLPSKYIYGLGERHEGALISTNWERLVFWTRDQRPRANANLYGDHPFYICIEEDGNSHGIFLLNSNAKEIELQPAPAITWRTIGGILDFYVFLGPTTESVVQQYTAVVGRPFLPPYWALGFHLCRWGYTSANATWQMADKMRSAFIPQDVQWNDIDYMKSRLDFTYDSNRYSMLPQLVDDLHNNGQHYVMIIDPGISDTQNGSYNPYNDGISMGVFINDSNGEKPIEGLVWPGKTVFPDYTNPKTAVYWKNQLLNYHAAVPFDGVWVDMNEPSNFGDGSTQGCPSNNLEKPPYVPRVTGNSLQSRTLCSSARHYNNNSHYDVHSLTGLFEMKATSEALVKIRGKRPFVISRSTFPSAGRYGGHWNGDIRSNWDDLKQSITSVINFNMFGIPLIGSDICGFGGDTTEELCTRWMQLGAFYPFCRNHNNKLAKPQAPVDFSKEAQDVMRNALLVRYSLLPYLYSLFFKSNVNGGTVARGLFQEFPTDKVALHVDEQFMWGSALMISPVLKEKSTTVHAYFPAGVWYFIKTGSFGDTIRTTGQWFDIYAPLSDIPLHMKGGTIIPTQNPEITTTKSRSNPISLIVAPDQSRNAMGFLYWDDGDSLDNYKKGLYLSVSFILHNNGTLSSHVVNSWVGNNVMLSQIIIFNAPSNIKSVTLNGIEQEFVTSPFNVLDVKCFVDLNKPFQVEWNDK